VIDRRPILEAMPRRMEVCAPDCENQEVKTNTPIDAGADPYAKGVSVGDGLEHEMILPEDKHLLFRLVSG
jgi:hypothetical protein